VNDTPISIASYPRAILHVDGDAFFASVEQALEPALRGKPVVTGQERGIIACANYAAKACGVKRGVTLFEARQLYPGLVILPSDYETYSLYSKRMFDIMRRYTPSVEEYSIDEAFADITGMRRLFRCSYEDIARKMQAAIGRELGITVSVGLSLSKSLAKICSKFRKPHGFTAVPGNYLHLLLQRTPLDRVWGFGPNTVSLLEKIGLRTAYDFVMRPETWAEKLLHKPGREIWNELRGNAVWKVTTEKKTTYATILKSKTFTPATGDKDFVYAQLVRNAESALLKARRYRLRPKLLGVVLRHHDFRHDGAEARLSRPTSATLEVLPLIRAMFARTFRDGALYRATMIVLGALESDRAQQYELFEDRVKIESLRQVTAAVDGINREFGKHTVCSGTSLHLGRKIANARDAAPARRSSLALRGETQRQRVAMPRWNLRV
jgi:DNA polymerase-4/DNA polymerase V